MKQRNTFAFDMLDFDSPESSADVVWVAGRPAAIREVSGDIVLSVPMRAKKFAERMDLFDDDNVALESAEVRIRGYGGVAVRLTAEFGGGIVNDDLGILHFEDAMRPDRLSFEKTPDYWKIFDQEGRVRATVGMADAPVKQWKKGEPFAHQNDLAMSIFPDGGVEIPLAAYDRFVEQKYESLALAIVRREGVPHRALFSIRARPDEKFAGTGERFAPMNLAGKTLLLENTDGIGVNNRRTYKNIPFVLSSRPYGLFMHTSSHIRLSIADISTRAVQGLIEEPAADLFFIGGGSPERILRNYRRITGFPPELPLWSYGTWMSRMTYFTAEEVRTVVRTMREGGFPLDVIHLDTGWFAKDWVCEWEFGRDNFPDPPAFMKEMRGRGIRITLWQTPYIGEGNKLLDEAKREGYIAPIKEAAAGSGSDFSGGKFAGHLDFSNPKSIDWYKSLLRNLLRMGASAIKTDFGEDIDATASYFGLPFARLHNLYALLYQRAAFEVTREVTGEGIVWARAGWAGCQRYPLHWGGDSACTWEGMAGSLRGGLHLGLSGFAFWSHDVPGFHGVPDFMNSWPSGDLYVRWTQFGVFSSHLRYHGTTPREPYEYPDVADTVRKWLKFRYAIIPYLMQQARTATTTGFPVLRALLLHHPDDPVCWTIDDQFYFGDDILVAPVMNAGGRRDIYLPQGEWIDLWSGKASGGETWLRSVSTPLERIPLYARRGARIPIYPHPVQCTDEIDLSRAGEMTIDAGFTGIGSSALGPVTGLV